MHTLTRTVHFILEGSEKRHSIDCDLRLTVEAMRESIASSWGISLQNIAISFNGERRGGRRGKDKEREEREGDPSLQLVVLKTPFVVTRCY